jgi:hypothetical protein
VTLTGRGPSARLINGIHGHRDNSASAGTPTHFHVRKTSPEGAPLTDQVSLGVLVNAVPRDLVDDAVAVCGVREKRADGKLPVHVITYLTLALCLFPDDDYTEVATKVTGSLDRWGC